MPPSSLPCLSSVCAGAGRLFGLQVTSLALCPVPCALCFVSCSLLVWWVLCVGLGLCGSLSLWRAPLPGGGFLRCGGPPACGGSLCLWGGPLPGGGALPVGGPLPVGSLSLWGDPPLWGGPLPVWGVALLWGDPLHLGASSLLERGASGCGAFCVWDSVCGALTVGLRL